MSNENLLSRITVDSDICHGKPCVRGLRYPVETILEYLAGGDSVEDLLREFPDLEREDILACHEFRDGCGRHERASGPHMRFLVDAHLPRRLCAMLAQHGHDAVHTLDLPAKNETKNRVINQISR